ncbi:uncharacterized protein KGF55_005807 [Candida pseudojiufengensis]|uniref:uncharacterized protein n=1 Tax=Candida pseudojiufengensis TaxID=497109 RepID=UPI00222429BE|nr:uncharacterized protein KGF55_005807 [Candida pseudojiufengensis]KAI5958464.1 hypothetical protein KGF55_005807 [Candida pseudojiufengensis]
MKIEKEGIILEYEQRIDHNEFPFYPTKAFNIIIDVSVNGYLLNYEEYIPFLNEIGSRFSKFMENRNYKTALKYNFNDHTIILQCLCLIKNESTMKLAFVINEFEGTILKLDIRTDKGFSFRKIQRPMNTLLSMWLIHDDYQFPFIYSIKARQQLQQYINASNNFLRESYKLPILFGELFVKASQPQNIGSQNCDAQRTDEHTTEEDYFIAENFNDADIFDASEMFTEQEEVEIDDDDDADDADDDDDADDADDDDKEKLNGQQVPSGIGSIYLGKDNNVNLQDVEENYEIIIDKLKSIASVADNSPFSAEYFLFGRSVLKDFVESHQNSGAIINLMSSKKTYYMARKAAKMNLLTVLE